MYQTIDEVIADDAVNLVVLATPHDTHAELSIKAMDAGKHVVTDKIMAMNAAEADAMIEASERNNVLLSVFHNRRWDWDYNTVKKIIDAGLARNTLSLSGGDYALWTASGLARGQESKRWHPLRLARTLRRSGTATCNGTR